MLPTDVVTPISPELKDRLRAMPKVEIHVHIEGATDAETFYQMAQQHQVELPADSLEAVLLLLPVGSSGRNLQAEPKLSLAAQQLAGNN